MSELGPPPAPKPVTMPPMSAEDKKKLGCGGCSGGSPPPPPPGGHAIMASPMPMMGGPMMGGYPGMGSMGPNIVFNYYPSYGMPMAMAAVVEQAPEEPKKEPKKCPPIYVQGDPTWCRPREIAKKGTIPKDPPCVIM